MDSSTKRIMIIGQPGSGKSTLARRLGNVLDLPVVHIDHIHWKSGWVERSDPEKDLLCSDVHSRDAWIFEGGRSVTWPERLDRADTLIWLDFPITVRAWRVLWRTIKHHGETRPDLPDGCPENFNWEFTRWIWDTRNTGRQLMRGCFYSAPKHKETHRLQSRLEVERFINNVVANSRCTPKSQT